MSQSMHKARQIVWFLFLKCGHSTANRFLARLVSNEFALMNHFSKIV